MNKILSKEVSYPIAKLLNQKGYNELCRNVYNGTFDPFHIKRITECSFLQTNSELIDKIYSAPTIGEVVDWIIDKHGIWISLECDCYGDTWFAKLKVASTENWDNINKRNDILNSFMKLQEHNIPHNAYEQAIKHILEYLI